MSELREIILAKLKSDPTFVHSIEYGIDFFVAKNVPLKKSMFGEMVCESIVFSTRQCSESRTTGFVKMDIRALDSLSGNTILIFQGWLENENDFDRLLVMTGLK